MITLINIEKGLKDGSLKEKPLYNYSNSNVGTTHIAIIAKDIMYYSRPNNYLRNMFIEDILRFNYYKTRKKQRIQWHAELNRS